MKHLIYMRLTAVFFVVAGVALAPAQQIFTRGDLNSLLAGNQTLERFETFSIADGGATNLDIFQMDSNSIANGQGPGLVMPGATYLDPSQSQLQWNGNNYYGMISKTLLANGALGTIDILYSTSVQAMGLDLKAFQGYGYQATVSIYDTGNNLVGSVGAALASGGAESAFVGWQNNGGIGRVSISSANYSWSPMIDDHGYGPVPEPASMIALGAALVGLVARRRRR